MHKMKTLILRLKCSNYYFEFWFFVNRKRFIIVGKRFKENFYSLNDQNITRKKINKCISSNFVSVFCSTRVWTQISQLSFLKWEINVSDSFYSFTILPILVWFLWTCNSMSYTLPFRKFDNFETLGQRSMLSSAKFKINTGTHFEKL